MENKMRNKHLVTLAVTAALSYSSVQANEYQATLLQVDESRAIKDKYIVVFNTPSVLNLENQQSIATFATQQGTSLNNKYDVKIQNNFGSVLNAVLVDASEKQIKQLLSDPSVAYIEQDQMMYATPIEAQGDQPNATWGLDRIDQRSGSLDGNYHYDFDGTGVTAYVVDTGVLNTHNEFGGRSSSGYDFVDNDSNSTDCNGHGTHVAGTIAGSTYGVAKNVNIVGVRVLGCNGSGTNSGVIQGINWVKNNASGPSVANMSLGGGASQATDDAVNSAVAAGITFVVAAGNDNSNACNYSPARAANAITVGSTANGDSRSSFSNYGNCLDIYAPGSSITSAWYNSNSATNTISGTSMAAPHVAGVAALYLDENNNLSTSQVESLLNSRASSNKVTDAKSGSPNKMLFALAEDTGCGNNCPVDATELSNNQGVAVSGATGSTADFFIDVPQGATNVKLAISGGSGDADLYVYQGQKATLSKYSCRPYKNGNAEVCEIANPVVGKMYAMVHGYSTFNTTITGTLTTGNGGCTESGCLDNGIAKTGLSGGTGSDQFYQIDVPANSSVTVNISGGSGDADLYIKKGTKPSSGDFDCRPYKNGNVETCNISVTQATTVHVLIKGYNAYSGVSLKASY
jgi:serine protease